MNTFSQLNVLSIPFQSPWIEAVLLEAGADLVTTLDYVAIKSSHPQVKAIEPWKMSENYLRGSQEKFDAMVSFSSLEHSGLGR